MALHDMARLVRAYQPMRPDRTVRSERIINNDYAAGLQFLSLLRLACRYLRLASLLR
jgi:hypothetical protein